MTSDRLTTPWWALRTALGAAAFLAGLDKYFNLLANWPGYLSPFATGLLPLDPSAFMHLIGIVEMAVGLVILAGYTRLGGYVAAAWLVGTPSISSPPAGFSTSRYVIWRWRLLRSRSPASQRPVSAPRPPNMTLARIS